VVPRGSRVFGGHCLVRSASLHTTPPVERLGVLWFLETSGMISDMVIQEAIVYGLSCICHPAAGVRYIGKTVQRGERRLRAHRQNARNGFNQPVYKWMRKHGVENIISTPLYLHTSLEALNAAEITAIERHKTHVSQGGMNVTFGGDGGKGYTHSAETRERMSIAKKGKPQNPIGVAKRAAIYRGMKRTDEQKANISASLAGRKLTSEHKAKLIKRLTDKQVEEIRSTWALGVLNQTEIGEKFGVSRITINRILRGHSRVG